MTVYKYEHPRANTITPDVEVVFITEKDALIVLLMVIVAVKLMLYAVKTLFKK